MENSGNSSIVTRFRRGLVVGIVLGLAVYLGYAVWVGWREVASALASFSWGYLPVLLALSLGNYAVRFVRWELYLKELAIAVPRAVSLRVFLAGMAMTVTPGKVGEFLKSYLLKETSGVPMATSAPVVLVERIADLLSLLLLASFGVATYGGPQGIPVLAAAGVLIALGLLVLKNETLTKLAVRIIGKLPLGARIAPRLDEAAHSSRRLLAAKPLGIGLVLGALAWFLECAGYWLAFRGFGIEDFRLEVGVFAYAFSTVLGVVSPGGLGPTDVGLIELAQRFTPGLGHDVATAGSFIVRVCTLWFAVLLGARALLSFGKAIEVDVEAARRG